MLLPRAAIQRPYQSARVMAAATRAASAQAAIRAGFAVPITGAIPAGCFISQPRRTASPVVPYLPASSRTRTAVEVSAGVGSSGAAPVYRPRASAP